MKSLLTEQNCFNTSTTFDGPVLINFDVDEEQSLTFNLSNDKGEKVQFMLKKGGFLVDRSQSGIANFNDDFPVAHQVQLGNTKVNSIEIYVDAASLEIFINEGEIVLTELVFPSEPYTKANLKKAGADFCISPILPVRTKP